jgi:hypothetical protein
VAYQGAGTSPDKAAEEDAGRKDKTERSPDRRTCPATVL